ncbi:hypothetical protein FIU89_05685 [Roseovarius sp. THAF27]|uniref:hypothetical protein n=1 Tax=unclassified Roseovarius TaxID=2614913 RepID=UPI0012687846|nr:MULTISPECIES: hypothetical protein [unclassified Roseovarius]QFT80098.1 hypothetical protein FIU89_05685 [Roseovarius sp. THAF27]QFT96803.1 hypothetical protein FIU85_05790 [Roseovarius sp. THAF8]
MKRFTTALMAMLTGIAGMQAAVAQEEELGEAVLIELNATKANESSCTLTFLVINGHPTQIDKAVYETVLFDSEGQVDRLTLFDFGALPPGRPRVRQFSVPGMACDGLGQVLINGAHTCEAAELPDTACETGLKLETRTNIEVTG